MVINETLDFLYGLQMFGIKLGLEHSQCLLQSVDNPQNDYGIVHVAGTNGKGSVCAFLREILTVAGYRVGTYTSPHLHHFNERITINGRSITDDELEQLVLELRNKNPLIPATFFEFTTALALLYFSREQVDLVVLEVGMGGRLDATNVVQPLVSVITPISMDHASHLGSALVEIAAEKGGIIKSHTPVVIARQVPEVLQVLSDQAKNCHCDSFIYGRDFHVLADGDSLTVESSQQAWVDLHPGLAGQHQQDNVATALMALECLANAGYPVGGDAVRQGVAQVSWPGRLEWWRDEHSSKWPAILLDGAHNEAGALVLVAYLRSQRIEKIRWIGGFKVDKDVAAILAVLLPVTQMFYAVDPPVEEPYPADVLEKQVVSCGKQVQIYPDIASALIAARQDCLPGEIVVVAGSLFLVAACREYLLSL